MHIAVGSGVKLVGESFVSPGISPELGQEIKKAASRKLQAPSAKQERSRLPQNP